MKVTLSVLLTLLSIIQLCANGDPTDQYSALIGSANPTPRSITDVQMLSEKLYIHPGKYSYVTVKYVLWNNSDKDYNDIDYGFPVDYHGGGEEYVNSGLTSDYVSESSYTIGWQDDYIKEIYFFMDGKPLTSKASAEVAVVEPVLPDKKNYQSIESGDYDEYESDRQSSIYSSVYRRWFYTQFSIKKNEIITLEVRYAIRNSLSKSLYLHPLKEGSQCDLHYDLSPAVNWGDGYARDFSVEIDASGLDIIPGYFEESHYFSIKGLAFKRTGNIFSYQTRNFDFKGAEPIVLNYTLINDEELSEFLGSRITKDKYRIRVSNEQRKYPVSNLDDLDFNTAWIAVNGGINEKITIEFTEPVTVKRLLVVNGYHKNGNTYIENNRIKSMTVNITEVYSWMDENNKEINGDTINRTEYISFEPQQYQPLYFENIRVHPDVYGLELNQYYSRNKAVQIELIISDIYSGSKYNDTCISEILLF